VSGGLTAGGNEEMLQAIAHTPYAVGYLGGSFQAEASAADLESAMLEKSSW
jgi:ABC-type phosphate transport system substrate-binding protein